MNRWTFTWRTLRFRSREFVFLGLAVAVTVSVITGALLTGDSVRFSLKRLAALRRGRASTAVVSMQGTIAGTLGERLSKSLGVPVAPVLLTDAAISLPDRGTSAAGVQLCGIDSHFWGLAWKPDRTFALEENEAAANPRLADACGLHIGDWLVVRTPRLSAVPRDAAFADGEADVVSFRVRVSRILDDDFHGRFSLKGSQIPPPALYVSRDLLGRQVGAEQNVNTFLIDGEDGAVTSGRVREVLDQEWRLADAGLSLHFVSETGEVELRSERVFLPKAVLAAAMPEENNSYPVLTYLVNRITHGTAVTPYSFVAGLDIPARSETETVSGIMVNQWLAEDLGLSVGDPVQLDYSFPGPLRQLADRSVEMKVTAIVPIQGRFADADLMPDLPGLTDAGDCAEWDSALSIDTRLIRPKDEEYWDRYRGTPKAFVSYDTAVRLWENRFGAATAVRFPGISQDQMDALGERLRRCLSFTDAGIQVRDLAQEGIRGSEESVDFSQLFIGLSFFVILSGILLVLLVLSLSLEFRRREMGILFTLGFSVQRLRRMLLLEVGGVALPGGLFGVCGGIGYNSLILARLSRSWQGAVAGSVLTAHCSPFSLAMGGISGILIVLVVVWFYLRHLSAQPVTALFADGNRMFSPHRYRWYLRCGWLLLAISALVSVFGEPGRGKAAAGMFLFVGIIVLAGLTCGLIGALFSYGRNRERIFTGLSWRGLCRHPWRSISVVELVACAVFLVVSVGANRHSPISGNPGRQSGTGGFELYAELSMPLYRNMLDDGPVSTDKPDQSPNDLEEPLTGVSFSGTDGDDASCLNLNRTSRPRILGVRPSALDSRHAFKVSQTVPGISRDQVWSSLEENLPDGTIPAIADTSTIVWGLGRKVGQTFTVEDEFGHPVSLRFVAGLANSVLQGNIIIAESQFERLFPSSGGIRVILLDAGKNGEQQKRDALRKAVSREGVDIMTCRERLTLFAEVENTYLAIFLSLGFLGVLLGTLGVGILVQRNVLERAAELAVMRVVGFKRGFLVRMLVAENCTLVLFGLCLGFTAASAAILPAVKTGETGGLGAALEWLPLLALCGIIWPLIGALLATRGSHIGILSRE